MFPPANVLHPLVAHVLYLSALETKGL